MNNKGRPFQNISAIGWQKLILLPILTFYIITIGLYLFNPDRVSMCENIGVDFCAFWSAGRIINDHSLADVYDLKYLQKYQEKIYPKWENEPYEIFTVMYPPVFVFPLKYLSLINLPYSFVLWTILNLIGFILYLRYFARKTTGHFPPIRITLMFLLSFPVFRNFFMGQVNLWLMICAGEFIRAFLDKKPLKAGVWLGGWLLKPQLLFLILPYLIIRKKYKSLAGFAMSAAVIGLASLGLVGVAGIQNLKEILFGSAAGATASFPFVMMNWRMLGSNINYFFATNLGWIIIIFGTLITTIIALIVFGRRTETNKTQQVIALLGVLAATCATTWHAHIHMALILIPPMLYLLMQDRFNHTLFSVWSFAPTFLIAFMFIVTMNLELDALFLPFVEGAIGFSLNLILLIWALRQSGYKIVQQS